MTPQTYPMLARLRRTGAALVLVAAAGCTEFLTVPNPTVIDAAAINPVTDAPTLANSAQQNFATNYGYLAMYSGWFTGEIIVAETFPTRNEFALRGVLNTNGSLNGDVWAPLSVAISSARTVLGLALPTPTTNIYRAQTSLFAAYSFLFMGEHFCEGTVAAGPATPGAKLTTNALLDSAIANFTNAITIGRAINTALSNSYANAAFVGRARANLQRGNLAAAGTDADSVPAAFVFNLPYVDDLANRTRLANTFWQLTRDRGSVSVDSAWRKGDPRVTYINGATLSPPLTPQDPSSGIFYVQQKYPAYSTSIRLASKLEADYIKAEIGGQATQLALVALRRTAAAQPAYAGAVTAPAVLLEFMTQKGFDFFLEGKRLGDFRRVGAAAIAGMPVPGNTYFKPGFPAIGTQTCYPVPFAETSTNPNFP